MNARSHVKTNKEMTFHHLLSAANPLRLRLRHLHRDRALRIRIGHNLGIVARLSRSDGSDDLLAVHTLGVLRSALVRHEVATGVHADLSGEGAVHGAARRRQHLLVVVALGAGRRHARLRHLAAAAHHEVVGAVVRDDHTVRRGAADALDREAAEKEQDAAALYNEIDEAIRKIGGKHGVERRTVLQCRYLDAMAWQDVAYLVFGDRTDYSDKFDSFQRRVFNIHKAALEDLAQVLDL